MSDSSEDISPPTQPANGLGSGLRTQLILWWSLMMIFVLTATGAYVYHQRRNFLEDQLRQKGLFVARSLSEMLRDALLEGNFTQIEAFVKDLHENQQLDYVLLQDQEGQVLVQAGGVSMQGPEHKGGFESARYRLRFDGVATQFLHIKDKRFLEFSSKVTQVAWTGETLVRVGFDTSTRIDAVVERGLEDLRIVFFVTIPIGILLSILLAGWITRPLPKLVEAAEAIASGDYTRQIEVRSPRELGMVAHAFDRMRLRIQEQIRKLEEAYAALDRKVYELEVLFEVAKRMNFRSFSPELLAYLVDTAVDALQAEWGSLMMAEEEEGVRLKVRVVRGAGFDREKSVDLEPGEGIAGMAYRDGNPIIANQGSEDERFSHSENQAEFEKSIRNLVVVPLMVENQPIGVINIVNKKEADGFDSNDLNLLMALAAQAARSLENAKLYDQAIRESKTGLFVPRYFEARIHEEFVSARRFHQVFSLLVLDIDFFKKVNDTYGHLIGDEVLIKLAQFVLRTLREDLDVACRFGGEEFALLLPQTDENGAAHLAERLRRLVESEIEDPEKGIPKVTISVGIATYPKDADNQKDLFQVADDALYKAKEEGRNQVRVGREKTRFEVSQVMSREALRNRAKPRAPEGSSDISEDEPED